MDRKDQEMEIKDLWCAAYALATGCTLLKVLGEPGWKTFTFDDSDGKGSRALGEWRVGQALGPAHQFQRALQELKRANYARSPPNGAWKRTHRRFTPPRLQTA